MTNELDKPLKYIIFVILYLQIVTFMFNPKIKVQMLICTLVLTAIASVSFVIDMHKGIGEPNSKLSEVKTGVLGSFVRLLPDIIREQTQSAPIGWFIGFIATMNLIAILLVTKIEYNSTPTKKLPNTTEKKLKSVKGVFISIVISAAIMGIISYLQFSKIHFDINVPSFTIPSFEIGPNIGIIEVFKMFWGNYPMFWNELTEWSKNSPDWRNWGFLILPKLTYYAIAVLVNFALLLISPFIILTRYIISPFIESIKFGSNETLRLVNNNTVKSFLTPEKALWILVAYTFSASVYTLDTSRKLHKLFVNNLIAN